MCLQCKEYRTKKLSPVRVLEYYNITKSYQIMMKNKKVIYMYIRPFHTSSDLLGDLTTSSWSQIS